ncbi:sensor domain-containing diguanylate cyclase [Acidaminobacter sp. JC074]|uniref:sensor domain-containing diguanylate cyclase n=1 Tax=Acidaminobacter sp. JC074 TaxID=2530199 RepID=UPI001F0EB3DA|nr:sensor domain-containing diguanylate cyclase [Acidaminobacter sp. JC074]MCH4889307.1 sensor domain-containing diguanylate cyclase [Acidaminobacter sp. JC074]
MQNEKTQVHHFPMSTYFDRLDNMVFILNDKFDITYHNDAFSSRILDENESINDQQVGQVLKCSNSINGCGNSYLCKTCDIFLSVCEDTQTSLDKRTCKMILKEGQVIELEFLATTLKVGQESHTVFVMDNYKGPTYNREVFYQLFQNFKSGVAIYERVDNPYTDYTFTYFNNAAERIDNIDSQSVLSKKVTEVFPMVKDFGLFDIFEEVWESGRPMSYPITFYKDNRISGWRDNYVFKLPTGELVAVYEDVTEKKKAEERVLEARNWSNLILKTVDTSIFIVDCNSHLIEDVNDAGCKLLGLPREDIIGSNCKSHICFRDVDECPIKHKNFSLEATEGVLKKNGQEISILKTVTQGIFNEKQYFIASLVDISLQKEMERKLEKISMIDELTQVGNRRALFKELSNTIEYCRYNHKPLSVAILDIDNFKDYNDSYGHVKGDECLSKIAGIIRDELKRPCDKVYRYGGEEFVAVLSDTGTDGAYVVTEKLRKKIYDEQIQHGSTYVSVSIGVMTVNNANNNMINSIIQMADEQLYLAKEDGRNCVKTIFL